MRPLSLRRQWHFNFVYSHPTKDITQSLPLGEGLTQLAALLGLQFRNAHRNTGAEELQPVLSKKGKGQLVRHATDEPSDAVQATTPTTHDRAKARWLALDRPFLATLGVATAQGKLVPAEARKWKQINKFVEIFAGAIGSAGLADQAGLELVDFGAGRGYLTFDVHDWLKHTRGLPAQVTGVEMRPDLVAEGNASIAQLGLQGLRLQQGDVRDWRAEPMDVMIALNACDTATGHAVHLGEQAGARVILCSPCCHKQLRPQLRSPHPLRRVFRHGIHAEQQAEMLRPLLLESLGYETRVFAFVALEHTRKNKMSWPGGGHSRSLPRGPRPGRRWWSSSSTSACSSRRWRTRWLRPDDFARRLLRRQERRSGPSADRLF